MPKVVLKRKRESCSPRVQSHVRTGFGDPGLCNLLPHITEWQSRSITD